MQNVGTTHGCEPKGEWVIEGCGELCTLDKTKIVPMPWQLYESISYGFDEDKFGPKSSKATFAAARSTSDESARKKVLGLF